MGNGQTERFNHTLLDMLGTLKEDKKRNWKAHVAPVVHAYNCTRNDCRFSPFFLMFGRHPHLPVYLILGSQTIADHKILILLILISENSYHQVTN